MRHAGRDSWSFGSDLSETLHATLFVRDALKLDVPDGPLVHPPLAGEVPDLSGHLDAEERRQAAEQWPTWWAALLANESEKFPNLAPAEQRQRRIESREQRRQIIDPPAWSSLHDRTGLQAAAGSTFLEGCRWAQTATRGFVPASGAPQTFEWRLVRDVAEQVAAERDVGIGAVNGYAITLLVEGVWWKLTSPGVAICSIAAAREDAASQSMLRSVFESAVTQ